MKPKSAIRAFLLGYAVLATSTAFAASTTWNVDAAGNWVDDANWLSLSAPGATSGTASADVATFGTIISAARAVTVDTDRNIKGITFSANSSAYTLSSGNLLLTDAGTIQTSGAGSAHTDTISTAIAIQGDPGTAAFTGGSSTNTRLLVISGGVTGVSTGTNVTTLTLNGTNTGNNAISGIISNGSGGGSLALVKSGAGTWNVSNASNSYSGGTALNGGTLIVAADGALGNSSAGITFNGGTLQMTVSSARVITLTGAGNINMNVASSPVFSGKVTGAGALNLNQVGGNGTHSFTFNNTTNDFTGDLVTGGNGGSSGQNYTVTFNSMGDSVGSKISLTSGTTVGTGGVGFFYGSGATAALTLNNRRLDLNNVAGTAANVFFSNQNPTYGVTFNQDLTVSATTARTLTLDAVAGPVNTFAGKLVNGSSPAISISKAGGGVWSLTNTASTYTGITTVSAGALEVAKLDIGGNNSSIGKSSNAAANLVFGSGATLRYTGGGDSTDRAFTYGANANSTGFSLDASGSGAVSFTNTAAITNTQTGASQIRFYSLTGSNTGDNTLAATLTNNGSNVANVSKNGVGKWVLTGTNTYNGSTFANFGLLELKNTGTGISQTLGALNFNQSEGTLVSNNAGSGTLSTTFSSQGRANGGTGNILIQGGTNGIDNMINLTGAQGFVNVGTFFAGANYAARNATNGYARALDYSSDPNAAPVDTITASNHVKLTTTPASQAAITLLSLNLTGSGVSWATTSGTLTVPGIIKSGGGSQSTISGGGLTAGTNTELVVRTDTTSDSLAISSNLTQGTGGLTKSGAGTLTLSGANTYTGQTRVQSGTLAMGTSDVFANTTPLVIDSATLDAATFTDTLGTLDINTGSATINLGAGAALAFGNSSAVSWTDGTPGTLNITGTFVSGSSLRFGTTSAGLTAAQLRAITAAGFTNFALDASGFLTATPSGGPGPLDHFAISAISSPQTVGTPITGITLTAQDASNATVTSFSGTVTFGGTGGFSGTSGTFTAGVLNSVSVTPSVAGSNLTFTVTDGASHNGTAAITTIQTQYAAWSGGAAFDADANGDGVNNGLAWLLGAANKDVSALNKLPVVSQSGGDLTLSFSCLNAAGRGTAALNVQHSSDLGMSDPWTAAAVPESTPGSPVSGVSFTVTPGSPHNTITATIQASEAAAGKLFGRLRATP